MSRNLALEIGVDEGIEIQVRKLELHLARPVTAHLDGPVHIQLSVVKIGAATEDQVGAAGFSIDVRVTHRLMVQNHLTKLQLTGDLRRIGAAGSGEVESGISFHREARQLE